MSQTALVSLPQCFADVPDPRREHGRLHNLWDIIALTICAVTGGADSWVEVEQYGHDKRAWLETFLELPNGIPAHDTLGRVFALLDPAAFRAGFLRWTAALAEATAGRVIHSDGKTLRHSFDTAAGRGALHLVSAWVSANRLLLGQQAVDSKSNEITAIPELLRLLDLTGAIVTIDAMGCQKDIAAQLHDAGGDYILTLKENQGTLYEEVRDLFLRGNDTDFAGMQAHSYATADEGHGRQERRWYTILPMPADLAARHPGWKGLRSLGMVFSERQVGGSEATWEARYFLSSLPPKVRRFAGAVRGHWGIENHLHWVLDVAFREDDSRLRKGHGPENLALVRRLAASLLQREATAKGGVACKRKHAGWNDDYLCDVLSVSLL
jgi:predicted transposase YbfD/YdcC